MANRVHVAEAQEGHLLDAEAGMNTLRMDVEPWSREMMGVKIAMEWSHKDDEITLDTMEERRLELAYARLLARQESSLSEPLAPSSVDSARMLLVDASVQREAEHALQLDVVDRSDYYSWANPDLRYAPWMMSEVSPTEFTKFAEDDLKALASGRFDEVSSHQRETVELMLLKGAGPREETFERQLHDVHADLLPDPMAYGPLPKDPSIAALGRAGDEIDAARFGEPMRMRDTLTREEAVGVVDRLVLAQLADRYKENSRNLLDNRPGKNEFEPDPDKAEAAHKVVMAVGNGHVGSRLERATRIALEFQQERGIPMNRAATRSMEKAVARLSSSEDYSKMSDVEAAKALIVDASIQRAAADKLENRPILGFTRGETASEKILDDMLGRGSAPVFTKLAREDNDTRAVAFGWFAGMTDERGIGSAVKTAIYRSGRDMGPVIEGQLYRIAQANPVSKERDLGWIDKKARQVEGSQRLRAISHGPQAAIVPVSAGIER